MKLNRLFILLLLLNFGWSYGATVNDSSDKPTSKSNGDKIVKILAIGNSFSQDAIEQYLFELANADNIKVIIGNLYIGGASLDLHWNNAKEDKPAYQYRKIDVKGIKTNTPETSIADALSDEDWDYISFQQVSSSSGIYDTYVTPLPLLFDYVKTRATNTDVKYILHQTWAYAQNSDHKLFVNYNNDQMTMYKAIVDAVWRAKELAPIDMVVPAGTAIQNGRTSVLGDNFCKDGYHLEVNFGRYTAACTWFETIFKKSVIGNTYKPDTVSDYEAEIAQYAAHYAVMRPKEITELIYYKQVALLFENCSLYEQSFLKSSSDHR